MLESFVLWLNASDANLKFTVNYNNHRVDFLDISIEGTTGELKVCLFRKPTAKNTILKFDSFHPNCQRESIPFGEFLRIRRNCTDMETYHKHGDELKDRLLKRGYPHRLVRHAFKRAKYYDRMALLQGSKQPEHNRITCVVNHSTLNFKIRNIINKNWKILNVDDQVPALPLPLLAYRRNQNLRDMLVHTRQIKRPPTEGLCPIPGLPIILGNHRCGSCHACNSAIVSETVEYNNKSVKLRHLTNCRSKNIIYILFCSCGLAYVGETGREFRVRFSEHKSAIRTKRTSAPLVEHFLEMNHDEQEIKWCILEKVQPKLGQMVDITRKKRETFWIYQLDCVRHGLNEEISWYITR
ncbi:uncharacterized protein LOC144825196 [Lissotriton helveticus]